MDTICRVLNIIFANLDGILIVSQNAELYTKHLVTLFDRPECYSLVINPARCAFDLIEIDFLGYRITNAGVTPLPEKVKNYPILSTPHQKQGSVPIREHSKLLPLLPLLCSKSLETSIRSTVKRGFKNPSGVR